MSVSVADEEDVLELLTGEDEFDADIDEDAEEELLREDAMATNNGNEQSKHNKTTTRSTPNTTVDSSWNNKSLDDEEEDEDTDSTRRGRFRSERIMSLATVPSRRRDIPDSLDAVNVNFDNKTDKSGGNRRIEQKHKYYKQNQRNDGHNYRPNKGLLPLPTQHPMAPMGPHNPQRMVFIPPNVYGRDMQPNPNPVNTIHVNPHFRARMDSMPGVRPPEPQPMPMSANFMPQSGYQFNQNVNNSQPMLFNPQMAQQMRPPVFQNNNFYNNNNQPFHQTAPPHPPHHPQPHPHAPQHSLLPHPQRPNVPMQMDNQWRPGVVNPNQMGYTMPSNLQQPQPMPMNRPINPNPMQATSQQSYAQNYESFQSSYQSNQPMMMSPMVGQQPQQQQPFGMQNNFPAHNQFQGADGQRFPMNNSFNMGFNSQHNFADGNRTIGNTIGVHNAANNQMRPRPPNPTHNEMNPPKRPHIQSQPQTPFRHNKPLLSVTDQQKSEALRAAQMKTKRAKQMLTKKHQNVVKEVPIVRNANPPKKEDKELEAAVGVDAEYKKKLEEQKRLREEVLRKKEERRKAMAANRLKESQHSTPVKPSGVSPKASSAANQPQQQIATLLNRSPQLPTPIQKQTIAKRIVKPLLTTEKPLPNNRPVINRVVVGNPNVATKRSVMIKGLAASTSELTIRKLCRPIGAIESCKIAVTGGQKTATVTFARREDAMLFQSKHERTLLDLSIIQVSLIWFVYIQLYLYLHSLSEILLTSTLALDLSMLFSPLIQPGY